MVIQDKELRELVPVLPVEKTAGELDMPKDIEAEGFPDLIEVAEGGEPFLAEACQGAVVLREVSDGDQSEERVQILKIEKDGGVVISGDLCDSPDGKCPLSLLIDQSSGGYDEFPHPLACQILVFCRHMRAVP